MVQIIVLVVAGIIGFGGLITVFLWSRKMEHDVDYDALSEPHEGDDRVRNTAQIVTGFTMFPQGP